MELILDMVEAGRPGNGEVGEGATVAGRAEAATGGVVVGHMTSMVPAILPLNIPCGLHTWELSQARTPMGGILGTGLCPLPSSTIHTALPALPFRTVLGSPSAQPRPAPTSPTAMLERAQWTSVSVLPTPHGCQGPTARVCLAL